MSVIKFSDSPKIFGNRATIIVTDDFEPTVHNKHHGTAPADAVYIGRGSPWGNPYVIGKHGNRDEVIELYRRDILPVLIHTGVIEDLKGKHLVCFCKPKACHGDLLLEAANK